MVEKQATVVEKVKRRLYSLYPAQIMKLERLAKHSKIPQSEYLRQLIDAEYVRKFPAGDEVKN